jgi:hypothetical protein
MVEESGIRLRVAERVLKKFDITNDLLSWTLLSEPLHKDCILMLQGKLILGKPIFGKDIFLSGAREHLADFLTDKFGNELKRIVVRGELSVEQREYIESWLGRKEEMKKVILEGITDRYLELLVVHGAGVIQIAEQADSPSVSDDSEDEATHRDKRVSISMSEVDSARTS